MTMVMAMVMAMAMVMVVAGDGHGSDSDDNGNDKMVVANEGWDGDHFDALSLCISAQVMCNSQRKNYYESATMPESILH